MLRVDLAASVLGAPKEQRCNMTQGYENGTDVPDDMWGTPPKRRIKGSYESSDYAGPGRFGPREAGSVFAHTITQALILGAAFEIEQVAQSMESPMPQGVAFGSSFVIGIVLKVVANMLRNFGSSIVRDVGAWLWSTMTDAFGDSIRDTLFFWWPFGRRRRRRDDVIPDSNDNDDPSPRRRRPLLDWLFPRRRS